MADAAALPVLKACACVVDARGRLLVFDHPAGGGAQLPKGTIEPGESPEAAVRRELHEESGIDHAGALESLGTLDRPGDARLEGRPVRRPQRWHLFLMRSETLLPERFDHIAVGSPEEDGLVFSFRWLSASDDPSGFAWPYQQVIARVRAALAQS